MALYNIPEYIVGSGILTAFVLVMGMAIVCILNGHDGHV